MNDEIRRESDPGAQAPSTESKSLWTRDFIMIALINFATFIGFNMTNTGMPLYVSLLGGSDVVVGLVTSLTTVSTLFIRPFSGLILECCGRKRVLITGIAAMAVIMVAYAVFPIIGVILFIRFLHGVAWSITSTATATIGADAVPRRRFAEGMGYLALVGSIVMAVAPALSIALVQNQGVTLMIVIATGSSTVAVALAFFQRLPAKKAERKGKIRLSDLFEKRSLLPAGIVFLSNCAFGSISTFIALHGEEQGVQNIWMYFTVYAVVTLISRPVTGRIIDRTGFFIPGVASALGVIVTLIIIALSGSLLMFCLAGVIAGVGFGTGMGTLQTMAVAAAPPNRRAVATSTYFFGFDGGIGIGAAIAGAVAGAIGYRGMFFVMAAFPAAAAALFLLAGRKRIATYSLQSNP